jgi:hypothetical protein
VTIAGGEPTIVPGLDLSDFDRQMIAATGAELVEERAAIADLVA